MMVLAFAPITPTQLKAAAVCFLSYAFFVAALATPAVSHADMIYEFITMTCDPQSHSAHIASFHDWNKSGQERVARKEKNTYYFDDLAETHRTITCSLGDGQIVSLTAGKSVIHPANNSFGVSRQSPSREWMASDFPSL